MVDSHSNEEWRAITARFADNNLYQSCEYEVCRQGETGATSGRVVVMRDEMPIGAAQVRIKRIPVLGGGLAYVYRGPLWRTDTATFADFWTVLEVIRKLYVTTGGLALRVAPNLTTSTSVECVPELGERLGFQLERDTHVDRTIVVDLKPDLQDLRKGLAQKWRNGLNQAERNNLSVTRGCDAEAWNQFQRLYDEMWADKQFETGVSIETFGRLQKMLPEAQKMQVLLAWHEGQAVAGHVSSVLGDSCTYLLGASVDQGRNTKAAYLLQWKAIAFAKHAGARTYDLGGIDPLKNPGVYHFKTGLGGTETQFLGTWRAVTPGASKFILPLAEAVYRRLRPKARAR